MIMVSKVISPSAAYSAGVKKVREWWMGIEPGRTLPFCAG